MGDIVDWMFQSGQLDFPDPFEHEEPNCYYISRPPRCKYCGSLNVKWWKQDGKWRLFTKGQPHKCVEYFKSNI